MNKDHILTLRQLSANKGRLAERWYGHLPRGQTVPGIIVAIVSKKPLHLAVTVTVNNDNNNI
jgi:hypothetical protein